MAPGKNDNGRGVSQTGTVPKTKTQNDSSRSQSSTSQQDPVNGLNSTPSNLGRGDWLAGPSESNQPSQRRAKTSNADYPPNWSSANTGFEHYDTFHKHLSQALNQRPELTDSSTQLLIDQLDEQIAILHLNRQVMSDSEDSVQCLSPLSRPLSRELPRNPVLQNVTHENETTRQAKNVNVTKLPDRTQVLNRLSQIQDYIKQTTLLMSTLKNSGDQCHKAQYHKLLLMVSDLRDSELKLQFIIASLNDASDNEEEEDEQEERGENAMENGSTRSLTPVGPNVSNQGRIEENASGQRDPVDTDLLANLQSHYTSLIALQKKAEAQLRDGELVQERLKLQSSILSDHSGGAGPSTELMPKIETQLHNLQGRLTNVQEMYENRNELAHILGERDEELNTEYLLVQNKLEDIQKKKRIMNHLMEEVANARSAGSTVSNQQSANESVSMTEDYNDDSDSSLASPDILIKPNTFNGGGDTDPFKGLKTSGEPTRNCKDFFQVGIRNPGRPDSAEQESLPSLNYAIKGEGYPEVEESSESGKRDNTSIVSEAGTKCIIPKNVNEENDTVTRNRLAHMQSILSIITAQYSQGLPVPEEHLLQLDQHRPDDVSPDELYLQPGPSTLPSLSRETTPTQRLAANARELFASLRSLSVPYEATSNQAEMNAHLACDPPPPVLEEPFRINRQIPVPQDVRIPPTLEELQELTRAMQHETRGMHDHAASLASAANEVKRIRSDFTLHKKKTNTQAVNQKMMAELQARKREFEGLMRKDKGQTSAANRSNHVALGDSVHGDETGSVRPMQPLVYYGGVHENPPNRSLQPPAAVHVNRELPRQSSDTMSNHSSHSIHAGQFTTQNRPLNYTAQSARQVQPEAQRNTWPRQQQTNVDPVLNMCDANHPQAGQSVDFTTYDLVANRMSILNRENIRLRCENSRLSYVQDPFGPLPPFLQNVEANQPRNPPPHTDPSVCVRSLKAHIDQCLQMILLQHREIGLMRSALTEIIHELGQQLARSDQMFSFMCRLQPDAMMSMMAGGNDHPPHQSNLTRIPVRLPPAHPPLNVNAPHIQPNHTESQYYPSVYPQTPMYNGVGHFPHLYQAANNQAVPLVRYPTEGQPAVNNGPSNRNQPMLIDHGPWGDIPGPAPTLNNQVPPGNRTNNYLDNFRSYSRQNLLSTGARPPATTATNPTMSSHVKPTSGQPSLPMQGRMCRNHTQRPPDSGHQNSNRDYSAYGGEPRRSLQGQGSLRFDMDSQRLQFDAYNYPQTVDDSLHYRYTVPGNGSGATVGRNDQYDQSSMSTASTSRSTSKQTEQQQDDSEEAQTSRGNQGESTWYSVPHCSHGDGGEQSTTTSASNGPCIIKKKRKRNPQHPSQNYAETTADESHADFAKYYRGQHNADDVGVAFDFYVDDNACNLVTPNTMGNGSRGAPYIAPGIPQTERFTDFRIVNLVVPETPQTSAEQFASDDDLSFNSERPMFIENCAMVHQTESSSADDMDVQNEVAEESDGSMGTDLDRVPTRLSTDEK